MPNTNKRITKATMVQKHYPVDANEVIQGSEIGDNDVVLGRGNGIAKMTGNKQFREIVWSFREDYKLESRDRKGQIALKVIDVVRHLDPPGRFLESLSTDLGTYRHASLARAVEKTSQALREKKNKMPEVYAEELRRMKADSKQKAKAAKKTSEQAHEDALSVATADSNWEPEGIASTPNGMSLLKPVPMTTTRSGRPVHSKSLAERALESSFFSKEVRRVQERKSSPSKKRVAKNNKVAKAKRSLVKKRTIRPVALEMKTSFARMPEDIDAALLDSSMIENVAETLFTTGVSTGNVHAPTKEDEPEDIDDMFAALPPHLTAFFSGIYSKSFVSTNHHVSTTPTKHLELLEDTETPSTDNAVHFRDSQVSPHTVTGFPKPPEDPQRMHSLFLDGFEESHPVVRLDRESLFSDAGGDDDFLV